MIIPFSLIGGLLMTRLLERNAAQETCRT